MKRSLSLPLSRSHLNPLTATNDNDDDNDDDATTDANKYQRAIAERPSRPSTSDQWVVGGGWWDWMGWGAVGPLHKEPRAAKGCAWISEGCQSLHPKLNIYWGS